MALLSNQITPNPQKSSKDKLTSTQLKLYNMHTVNESTCGADASVLRGLMRVLHVHSHHLGVVITKVRRSVTMLNNAMGMTDDRSMKVGHYVATLAVVAW